MGALFLQIETGLKSILGRLRSRHNEHLGAAPNTKVAGVELIMGWSAAWPQGSRAAPAAVGGSGGGCAMIYANSEMGQAPD